VSDWSIDIVLSILFIVGAACVAIWAMILEQKRYKHMLKEEQDKTLREKHARESLAQNSVIRKEKLNVRDA
jgi:hypothetical protein